MTPINYSRDGSLVKFIYDEKELAEFHRLGQEGGNTGTILISIDYAHGGFKTYKGYGTIENPFRVEHTFHMKHWEAFDGPPPTPEEILHPKSFDELYPHAGIFIPDGKGKLRKL